MAMAIAPMVSGVLDAKTVEFLAIAVDASCTHMYAPGVRRHIRKALDLGATKEEIAAVLQCVSVLGIHTMSLGAPILLEELAAHAERQARPPANAPLPDPLNPTDPKETTMQFLDDSLLPENQQKLVIQVAPYGPQWVPGDSDDIAVTMDQQVQKAVDCWNAGATVLHVHVREDDGKGSKRLSKFNEMLARLREAVPQMILQVGGSISFAPESEGQAAKWMTDDTRHMLAELDPRPDQVTVADQHPADERDGADDRGRRRGHLAGQSRRCRPPTAT